jgi:hypothetical protein
LCSDSPKGHDAGAKRKRLSSDSEGAPSGEEGPTKRKSKKQQTLKRIAATHLLCTEELDSHNFTLSFPIWINTNLREDSDLNHLLPIKEESLFDAVKDGILLCKIINQSCQTRYTRNPSIKEV